MGLLGQRSGIDNRGGCLMGGLREDFGRMSIETRRESFYVHAGYGYQPWRRKLGDLALRAEVSLDGKRWRIFALTEDYVGIREQQFSTERELPPDTEVVVPGYEEDAPGPHAAHWREFPHPEFLYEDLDDLIAALEDLRDSR